MAPRSSPDAKSGLKRAASASALTTRGVRAAKKTKQCANDAVRSLIDKWLDSHPDQWAEIWANISTGFYDADVTGGNGGDDANEKWDASVQTFEQVNLQWLAQMLAKITGVPLPIFDLVDSFDSRALRKLCIVWFGIPLRLPVTDDLRDKVVMYRLMQLRHEELGRRSYEFQKYVKTTGEIDWVAISPWQFKWEESVVTAVWHHLLGEVKIPPSLVINTTWSFEEIHDDMAARVVNEVGIQVSLVQIATGREKKQLPALAILRDSALKQCIAKAKSDTFAEQKAAVCAKTAGALTLRTEKRKEDTRRRRETRTKPSVALSLPTRVT